jgi:hypothetical protein
MIVFALWKKQVARLLEMDVAQPGRLCLRYERQVDRKLEAEIDVVEAE